MTNMNDMPEPMKSGTLSQSELKELLHADPPLVEHAIDIEQQLQVNGFELTLQRIEQIQGAGKIAFSNQERIIPETTPIVFNEEGWTHLAPGAYKVIFNEIVNIPNNIAAIGLPRSSLTRCGATLETAVWDAGYRGRSESLLVIYNPEGMHIKKDARILQLVFMRLSTPVNKGYDGAYQDENINL